MKKSEATCIKLFAKQTLYNVLHMIAENPKTPNCYAVDYFDKQLSGFMDGIIESDEKHSENHSFGDLYKSTIPHYELTCSDRILMAMGDSVDKEESSLAEKDLEMEMRAEK